MSSRSSNPGRRDRRVLAPEERQLWERVARTTDPLVHDESPVSPEMAGKPVSKRPAHKTVRADLHRPEIAPAARLKRRSPHPTQAATTFERPRPEVSPVGRPEAGLDRRTADRLRRGARHPDARIDLHGMRAERAHQACLQFLSDCVGRGLRVVLVITGKGRSRREGGLMASGRGILRESLPGWLRASSLGPSIVGIYEAHPRHGGAGAFYVYLKRRR